MDNPAGKPSTMVVRQGPCDSPPVRNLCIMILLPAFYRQVHPDKLATWSQRVPACPSTTQTLPRPGTPALLSRPACSSLASALPARTVLVLVCRPDHIRGCCPAA